MASFATLQLVDETTVNCYWSIDEAESKKTFANAGSTYQITISLVDQTGTKMSYTQDIVIQAPVKPSFDAAFPSGLSVTPGQSGVVTTLPSITDGTNAPTTLHYSSLTFGSTMSITTDNSGSNQLVYDGAYDTTILSKIG